MVFNMSIEDTSVILKDIFGMSFGQAKYLERFIKSKNLSNFLELGFAHGVSSCYLATILNESGGGHLTTIDLKSAKNRKPNIEELLNKLNLQEYVSVYYEYESYNWRLMKFIEENDEPIFDFCYIDGAHDWNVDGFAFLLVDKLLKPGGWIIFDDMDWSFGSSPSMRNIPRVSNMPDDVKNTPHVAKVFDLLVRTNPDYGNFEITDFGWGIAQKINSDS